MQSKHETGVRKQKSSRLSRLGAQLLASTLSALLVIEPLMVELARAQQAIVADPNASANNRPTVGAAGNGVPLIDIARPNAAGLSHNQYSDFNVGTAGVILNNSTQEVSRSQLGGLVQGNANLKGGNPASVILNEVTSARPSALNGMLEVHGTSANVVVANPNGIACDGCGFINTPRVTLSTGKPEIGASGALEGFRVEGGAISFGRKGADLGQVDLFDILSRSVSFDGPVKGKDSAEFRVAAGRNHAAYESGLITPLPDDGKGPAVAIDSSAFGGMYAGKISIVATDRGAGVRAPENMVANSGQMSITADGRLVVGKVEVRDKTSGRIALQSKHDALVIQHTLYAGKALTINALTGVELAAAANAGSGGDVDLNAGALILGKDARLVAGMAEPSAAPVAGTGNLTIRAGERVVAGEGFLGAGGDLFIQTGMLDLKRAIDTGADSVAAKGAITLRAQSVADSGAVIAADGALAIDNADALVVAGHHRAGAITVAAASLTLAGEFDTTGLLSLSARAGDLINTGVLNGSGGIAATAAGKLVNTGRVETPAALSFAAGTAIRNKTGALVNVGQATTLKAQSLANAGGSRPMADLTPISAAMLQTVARSAAKVGSPSPPARLPTLALSPARGKSSWP
jgi:filamentous hemagglutinin family protein